MKEGLDLLREPFPEHQIGKLPKPTKAQTDEVKQDFKKGIRCKECGGWHHPKVVHLDYVGHAALTDRFLNCDPNWWWEPLAYDKDTGLPVFDNNGGLWIKLHICGVTRLGYGNAAAKNNDPGNREKEVIGDALRNAGMRFGAALDLWHKGDLHVESEESETVKQEPLSLEQGENLNRLLMETDTDLNTMFSALNITTVDPSNYDMVINKLQQKYNKMQQPINNPNE